jgi:predicted DNA-binding protein (MmcQ/YjbR family)
LTLESLRAYCLAKKGVTEEFPFGEDTLVYKVGGKMFALTNSIDFDSINLKCDPERSVELRERYEAVTPGYHMNKKHWNTIMLDICPGDKLLRTWIDHSYDLVVEGLTKKQKSALDKL